MGGSFGRGRERWFERPGRRRRGGGSLGTSELLERLENRRKRGWFADPARFPAFYNRATYLFVDCPDPLDVGRTAAEDVDCMMLPPLEQLPASLTVYCSNTPEPGTC